jgi:hypothetical protein
MSPRRRALWLVVAAAVTAAGILAVRNPGAGRRALSGGFLNGERSVDLSSLDGPAAAAVGLLSEVTATRNVVSVTEQVVLPTAVTVPPQPALADKGAQGAQGPHAGEAGEAQAALPTGAAASPADRPLLPLQPRRLTQNGCCGGAWWSEDSSKILFVDRPDGAPSSAIYGAALWPPDTQPTVVDAELMLRSGASRLVVRPSGAHSIVEDPVSGDRWPLPTGGNPVRLSPDGSRAVWWEAQGGWAHNNSLVKVYGSDVYGFDKRELGGMWGTHVVSFLPDNRRVLVEGRPVRDRALFILATMDVETGKLTEVARGMWLSDASLSRDGSWVAYMTSLDREDPDANGIWAAPTVGGEARKLGFVGAYRWRDDSRLVYVPMVPGAESHEVWQVDVATGETTRLIGPDDARIRIANNDWSISPDGATLSYVSEDDRSIWVIDLP